MKLCPTILLFSLCLSSCLEFGNDIEMTGAEITDEELTEVTRRTGIDFPEGAVGLGYYFQGSGIDDALALKALIPNDKILDFLKNDILEKGDKSKASIQIGRDKPWWNLDELKERVDRKMQLPKGKYVECTLGKENGKWTVYVSWMST
ncbi:MAG: hypothetical protein O3A82_02795 [Verrucomicrobia bacterium]|nr:hypothetical protein [Verrucomicrobiota bacterium]MDA1045837.1 hypothetical protein [Verrucomicrobiota bacterium]